jgi:hypothetical protein
MRVGLAAVAAALLALPAGAAAADTGVLAGKTIAGGPLPCETQADGIRVCRGDSSGPGGTDLRLKSWDGQPLALFVTLPPAPASGRDGGYPLIVQSHGWAAPPSGPDDAQYGGPTARQWAKKGYAVLQLAARGWGDSCGTPASRLVSPAACANGYLHLDDYRYEARDVQHAVGLLVDEGIADPRRVGAMGESYGGGVTLELAALKNRVMKPDGSLIRWKSPNGTRLRIAAAAPFATWSDLANSLAPNGRTLDSGVMPATYDPVGVEKSTIVTGLYQTGLLTASAYYAPPGVDREADLARWLATISAGEPYDTPEMSWTARQITKYHSPYYLLAGAYGFEPKAPPPLHLANGWTDDIFPVDEVVRAYQLVRSEHPSTPLSMLLMDVGHQRAQNKAEDLSHLVSSVEAFFDHYVKGQGRKPRLGVTAYTQTCPADAPSDGPFRAPTWGALAGDELEYRSKPVQTVDSLAGDAEVATAFDPVLGGLACTSAPARDEGPGVAAYELPAATGSGYTMLGSPTVTADLHVTGQYAYLAARLLDVDPETGRQTLVARGTYRIDPDSPNGVQTFQLHPNGWKFADGHIPTFQLLGRDAPYSRPSNGAFQVKVQDLRLRLPIVGEAKPCSSRLAGTRKDDELNGTSAGDRLLGRRGDDRIRARGGDDCVKGGAGADRISAGPGRDKAAGGPGNDIVRSRDGERDVIRCGKGRGDRAITDRRDEVRGCERERAGRP